VVQGELTVGHAFVAEFILTFMLMWVVMVRAAEQRSDAESKHSTTSAREEWRDAGEEAGGGTGRPSPCWGRSAPQLVLSL